MRARGLGRIFLRGATFWIQYYVDGRQLRESAETSDRKQAEKFLRDKIKEKHAHELNPGAVFLTRKIKTRKIGDLVDALRADFVLRGKSSAQNFCRLERVRADFGNTPAMRLTGEDVDGYIQQMLEAGYAKASVNRVTQILQQCYQFAGLPAPRIRKLSELGNERQGFFSAEEIERVISALPEYLQDFTRFGFCVGMRASEIRSLSWENVDGDVIRLRGIDAKTGEARMIPMVGELAGVLERRRLARQIVVRGVPTLSALFFHRGDGRPIGDYRKAWATACRKAGICRHFHDLRRSAARNMLRSGVSQRVAMQITGHRTDSMFRRYAIVAEGDLRTALLQTQEHMKHVQENVVAMPVRGQNGDNLTSRRRAVGSK